MTLPTTSVVTNAYDKINGKIQNRELQLKISTMKEK